MRPDRSAVLALAAAITLGGASDLDAQRSVLGLSCDDPDLDFEPGSSPGPLTVHTGNAFEPVSGRPLFLDFPCELEPGEPVTVVLNRADGRVVADLIRIDKGHTDGLRKTWSSRSCSS